MRVLLGMSGGLDSTYAACMLKEMGHEVVGCALKMNAYTAVEEAQIAAEQAGIPLVTLDCTEAFEAQVIAPFIDEYVRGRTPNPCVRCNRTVKIETLCRYAREHGFDCVSTGHYSFVKRDGESGRYFVCRADDPSKDQSYVLWGLTQEQLAMLYLPLAGARKKEIRERAAAMGLRAAESKESMENCFIPEGSYGEFLASRGVEIPTGDFVDTAGNRIGTHRGIVHYTIGQRKGLGLAMGRPVFVTAIDPLLHTVTVGEEEDLFSSEAKITDLVFQKLPPSAGELRAEIKIRYAAKPVWGTVTVQEDLRSATVRFDQPVRAVTPGQSAVCYENGEVLMGGICII